MTENAEADLGLDLVALGDGDLAHVVAEAGDLRSRCASCQPAAARAQRAEPLRHDRVLPVADDHLAAVAQARLDEAELAVAVGGLVEVHEVHVDLGPGQVAVELRVQVQRAACAGRGRPAIHILAGEKVCIQAMRPMQFGAASASRRTWAMSSGVVTTGLTTIRTGTAGGRRGRGDLAGVLRDLAQDVLAVQVLAAGDEPGLEVRQASRPGRASSSFDRPG